MVVESEFESGDELSSFCARIEECPKHYSFAKVATRLAVLFAEAEGFLSLGGEDLMDWHGTP